MPSEYPTPDPARIRDHCTPAEPLAGMAWPAALHAALLDPALWRESLHTYARATHLAVALSDAQGDVLGECLNPQPTWHLLKAAAVALTSSPPGGARRDVRCPFSLASRQPCTCIADALATGHVALVHDRMRLVHFAVPLLLGSQPLGAVIAGQVFDQYPDQAVLEQVARQLGLSPTRLWQQARLEVPVKRDTLRVYADLLETLSQTFLQTRYDAIQEAERLARMQLDITERKQAEAALETQRNWFDGTLSSIGDGVIATDVHSIIIFLNTVAEELTGWSAAEALGRPLDEVCRMINEQTREPVADNPVTLALREDRTIGLANPTLLITRYGAELSIAHSAAPIRDRRGTRHGGVFVFRDSTATRRLEAQLRETQRMEALGTLAGGIAHGFNNMLAAILGFSELLRGEVEPNSRAAEYLHEVRTAGLRAKDLVQQILTFSHRDVGEFAPFQLQLLVYETMRLLRASLPATIEIREHLNATFGTVMGNPAQLQQVLMNLASNAEHAMRPTGGVLDVRLDDEFVTPDVAAHHPTLQPGSYLRLSVQDTGSGMTSDVLERIYEPFFTTKDVGQGTGMGLAIVHGIVTSHGGATTVASTPGQGSTFTVYLPRLADTAVADPAAVMPLPQGQERLLVVEDDTTLARLLQIQLTSLGYTVQVYTSSREALAAFQTSPPAVDLVLTDQTMPYMTGETLVQELRRLRPELPIILFTGYSPLIDAAKARALGIDAFLLKPLNTYDLAQTIRHVLEQRRTSRC